MRTLNVSDGGYDKFVKIRKTRPQDKNFAETFDHILKYFEEAGKP
jgi:hypothetical protein